MTSGKKTISDEIVEFAQGSYYFRFDELRQSLVNQHPGLSTDTLNKTIYLLKKPGTYRVLVKVVDIFGNDTTQGFEVEVK